MSGVELILLAVGAAFLVAFWAGALMAVVLVVRLAVSAVREWIG